MREGLAQLAEIAIAIALTAVTLGSMLYLADGAKRVAPIPLPPPPPEAALLLPPSAASPPAASVTYRSLDELRARCVDEVRKPLAPRSGADSYCSVYARVTRGRQQDVVAAAPAAPGAGHAVAKPVAPEKTYPVSVNDCRSRGYGSIAYRKCRAAESKRLSKECNERQARLNLIGYRAADDESGWARAWCYEANRYQIID